jgi:hypothetical protein
MLQSGLDRSVVWPISFTILLTALCCRGVHAAQPEVGDVAVNRLRQVDIVPEQAGRRFLAYICTIIAANKRPRPAATLGKNVLFEPCRICTVNLYQLLSSSEHAKTFSGKVLTKLGRRLHPLYHGAEEVAVDDRDAGVPVPELLQGLLQQQVVLYP